MSQCTITDVCTVASETWEVDNYWGARRVQYCIVGPYRAGAQDINELKSQTVP
jgi:hypothetical protein